MKQGPLGWIQYWWDAADLPPGDAYFHVVANANTAYLQWLAIALPHISIELLISQEDTCLENLFKISSS